jgi:hypothetical protein
MRQRVGRTLIDGFAHFIADAADDGGAQNGLYLRQSFQGASSFRSVDSVLSSTNPTSIPALIELLAHRGPHRDARPQPAATR